MRWLSLLRDRERPKGHAEPEHASEDEQAILSLLVTRAQARIDGQLRDSDALDTKALGVLAVDAAAIGVMIAVHADVSRLWWVPTTVLGIAGLVLSCAVWPREFDTGPDTRRFYEDFGGATGLEARRQMLAELLKAIDQNDELGPPKSKIFKWGFALLVLALLGCVAVILTGQGLQ